MQVLVALLVGIWAGALLVSGFDPLSAFLRTFDTYFVGAFVGEGNAEVLLFTFLLGGTIGLVQRSGGALGLANALKRFMGEGGDVGVVVVVVHSGVGRGTETQSIPPHHTGLPQPIKSKLSPPAVSFQPKRSLLRVSTFPSMHAVSALQSML